MYIPPNSDMAVFENFEKSCFPNMVKRKNIIFSVVWILLS